MTGPDLDALEKRLRDASDDFADHATPIEGDGQTATLLREAADVIAELKEARGLITDIAASKITEDNPYIWKWASEVMIKARAFLARNGKGEG